MPQPPHAADRQLTRDVYLADHPHLGETGGDWGLSFVLRLMFARWP